jgi:hypothetical protein
VYIDMGDIRIHRGIAPFTGNRWYIGEVCEDLLDRGVITRSQCKAALRTGTRLSCEKFTEAIEKITQVCSQVSPRESFAKNGILAMNGLWNATSQFAGKKVHSTYQIDAGDGLKHRQLNPAELAVQVVTAIDGLRRRRISSKRAESVIGS